MYETCDAGPRRSKIALKVVGFVAGNSCEHQIEKPHR
jgi:hypothetical protein